MHVCTHTHTHTYVNIRAIHWRMALSTGDFDFRAWRVRNVESNRALYRWYTYSVVLETCNVCTKKLVVYDLLELDSVPDRFQLTKNFRCRFYRYSGCNVKDSENNCQIDDMDMEKNNYRHSCVRSLNYRQLFHRHSYSCILFTVCYFFSDPLGIIK